MNWKPAGDAIIAKRVEITSIGGIAIPKSAQDQTVEADILAVGPEVKKLPQGFTGRALFGKYAGMEYVNGSDKLLLLRDEDIMAISDSVTA